MRKMIELGKDDLFNAIHPTDYTFRLEKWGTLCGIELKLSDTLQKELYVGENTKLIAWVKVTGSHCLDVNQIYIGSGLCSNQLSYDLDTIDYSIDVACDKTLQLFLELVAFTRYAILLKVNTKDILEIIRKSLNIFDFKYKFHGKLKFFLNNFEEIRGKSLENINLDNIKWVDYSDDNVEDEE